MSSQWPVPLPLEGVKSRKRAVFSVPPVYLKSNDKQSVNRSSGLELTLESRVAIVGDKLGSISDLLLGAPELVTGTVSRHDGLLVLHLGPHLLDTVTVEHSVGLYLAALTLAAALEQEQRPQVVILDEAAGAGNEAWGQAFRYLLDHQAMQTRQFRGALVICVAEETPGIRRICKHRWTGEQRTGECFQKDLIKDDICRETNDICVTDDICGESFVVASVESLRAQVSELAAQCFGDTTNESESDISAGLAQSSDISAVARQKGWKVAALTANSLPSSITSECQLLGYVTYGVDLALGGLYLARVAVVPEFRKRGHAAHLVRWLIEHMHREGDADLWVHAVPGLQHINLSLGFTYVDPADEAEIGSAWMVLHNDGPNVKETPKCWLKGGRKGQRQRRCRR